MAIVRTEGLEKVYKEGKENEVHALSGVNLEIEAGAFLAVMGPSGSGKSTLLNMLGCLDRPTAGEIFIDGVQVSKLGNGEITRLRREKIGFVFQSFNLIPTLTALENVMLPLRYSHASNGRAVATEALEHMGLGHRLGFRSNELSGGEQQRVAIARALVLKPAIVLADEPTGELDSKNSAAIMELLKRLNSEEGQTFIIVTHDPGVSSQAERILTMQDGMIVDG